MDTKLLLVAWLLLLLNLAASADTDTNGALLDTDEDKGSKEHTPVDISEKIHLFNDLRTGYNKRFRPVKDQSQTVYVSTAFDLISIKEFNEVEGRFSVIGIMNFIWTDENMAWDPANYSGIKDITVPADDFWRPIIVLTNPYDNIDELGDRWMMTRYFANGTAFFTPGTVLSVSCQVDVTYYPWDTQVCIIIFTSWGYLVDEITLRPIRDKVLKTYYYEGGIWQLDDSSMSTMDKVTSNGVIMFRVKRKPSFVIVNIILPLVFIGFLNLLAFILPSESGERMSYCVTVLLAIAVFLTLVGENIPKTSEPMSFFCYYMVVMVVANIAICITVVISLKVYYMGEDTRMPTCLQAFVRCCRCSCGRRQRKRRQQRQRRRQTYENSNAGNGNEINVSNTEQNRYVNRNGKLFRDLPYYDISYVTSRDMRNGTSSSYIPEKESYPDNQKQKSDTYVPIDNGKPVTWAELSKALDVVFFIVFLVILAGITATFMSILALNEDWNNTGWPAGRDMK